jgi:hypothetical protein
MNLGREFWEMMKPDFDRLELRQDGDYSEIDAFSIAFSDGCFSNYERFWRYHVAPASRRPDKIWFREGTDERICKLAQTSFSTFRNIFEAVAQLSIIGCEGLGDRERNVTIAMVFAGNALEMFDSLNGTAKNLFNKLSGDDYPKPLIPDWNKRSGELSVYRDHIVHHGTLMMLTSDTAPPLVLRRDLLKKYDHPNWAQILKDHGGIISHWQDIGNACRDVVVETLVLLDDCYANLVDQMDKLLCNPKYQVLWGWADGMETYDPTLRLYSYPPGSGTGSGQSSPSSTATEASESPWRGSMGIVIGGGGGGVCEPG